MAKLQKSHREKTVIKVSIISIVANFILVGFKVLVGFMANSIAIIIDAVNNLSDALSSIVTIIGTKLASRAPDKKHPYGYGRIEYMTAFIVSAIVLYAGATALIESVKKIIIPELPDYSTVTIVVLVAGIIIKFILGFCVKKTGKKINSDSLVASGVDAFNDAILSISVLVSAIIFMIWQIDVEAYTGMIVSVFIIKTGIELIKESVNNILGSRTESSLSRKIKKEITNDPNVQGAYDLILTDYGPDKYLGSVHIEVEDTLTVADIDKISRRITKTILAKYGVILHTIGIYSINTKDKNIINVRKDIEDIVFSHKGVLQMHGFYMDETDKTISLDIIIDFTVADREALYQHIYDEIQSKYKGYLLNITLDIDASD